MDGATATVTISLVEFSAMQNRLRALEEENTQLRRRPPAPVDVPQRTADLELALRRAVEVVRYAVANLPLETPGWPVADLVATAAAVQQLGRDDHEREIGFALAQAAGVG